MSFSECRLMAEHKMPDGHEFVVSIETGMRGLARLNVSCTKSGSDEEENSQGIDLTPAECRSLANMLNATALLVEDSDKG